MTHTAQWYHQHNARHFWHPMAHPREMLEHPPIVIAEGSGVEIIDIDGHRTLDGIGGLWCVNLGYSNDAINNAINAQLSTLSFYNCFRGTSNTKAIELSLVLKDFFQEEGLTKCFYTSGGSDSIDTALKISRQYHLLSGEKQRNKFIAFSAGYHGTHCGGASLCGSDRFRTPYSPLLDNCFHVPSPWTYHNPFDENDEERVCEKSIKVLEQLIADEGADSFAAVVMEPIVGSGGVIVPHKSFMPKVRAICDRFGILLIADEVITSFGRAGKWTGSRLWGVKPDILTCAKGISNGCIPFGVCMISEKIAKTFDEDTSKLGTLSTGYTYSGHPVAAAAAITSISEAQRLNVAKNARVRGLELKTALLQLQQKFSCIGDVRGIGLMHALELVSDRQTKSPLPAAQMQELFHKIYRAGLMVRISGNNIIISPPLVVTQFNIETLAQALETGFENFIH